MDMNVIVAGVTGIVSSLGTAIGFIIRTEKKLAPVFEWIGNLAVAGEQVAELKAEVIGNVQNTDPTDRDAHLKAAAYCALNILGVGIGELTDIQKAAITKYVQDMVSDQVKDSVTPENVDATLQLIQNEINAAKEHDGLKSAKAFMDWLSTIKDSSDKKVEVDQVQSA